jgi:hypothetical protein
MIFDHEHFEPFGSTTTGKIASIGAGGNSGFAGFELAGR